MLLRTMCYVNQFFAGMGGEEKADLPLDFREKALGPSRRFQELARESVEVVVTAYCGDNYFAEHQSEVLASILEVARKYDVKMFAAGPAFAAGRYGFACIESCHFLSTSMNIPCVSGMHVENPGVDLYKEYKDKRVFVFPTGENVAGMENALSNLARFVSKLVTEQNIGPASEEGYISRGFRLDAVAKKTGVERALDILLDKLAGRPFTTEIPTEALEAIPAAPPIADLENACLALVSTAGVVAPGNPDGFKTTRNTQWRKYSIEKMDSMKDAQWDVWHAGYNAMFMHENPNYGIPLDACREIEKEGGIGKLYSYFYVTPGNGGLISAMQAIGRDILRDMKPQGIDAALLVST